MKPIAELSGLGIEIPAKELQAEIAKRQSMLSTLPPAIPGLLGWYGEPPTDEQLAQRKELESEIGTLERQSFQQVVVAPIVNVAVKLELEQHQTNAFNSGEREGRKEGEREGRKVGMNEGMKAGRKQHQTNAATARHKTNRDARAHCRKEATQIWAANEETIRVGEMAQLLFGDLKAKGMYCPETKGGVKKWLIEDANKGLLTIPPEARKGGRPKK